MKVAVVQPYIDDGNLTPPLGPLYILALLEKRGFKVGFFDERLEGKEIVNNLVSFKPDIIGVGTVTAGFNNGVAIAKKVKKLLPKIHIAFGGPHVTALPVETLKGHDFIDFAFVREAEFPFLTLCERIRDNGLDFNDIPNLYTRNNGTIQFTKEAEYLTSEQLDNLPVPAYHLLNIEKYFQPDKTYGLYIKGLRNLPVMSSRGCPGVCTFCCHVMGYKFRVRNYMNVIDEMEYIAKTYKLEEVHIVDDNFTFNKDRAMLMLDEIIKRKLGIYIKFANGLRADKVDGDLLKKMKEAGCYTVGFGIESGSKRVLEMMKKRLPLDKVRKVIKEAKELGLIVSGNCIIGYPGETKADIRESLNFFHELKLDSMAIVSLVPFPGTESREIAEKNNWLTKAANDWRNYSFVLKSPIPLISTPFVSGKELKRIISRAYLRMYLKPYVIFKILKNMKSVLQLWRGIRILLRT